MSAPVHISKSGNTLLGIGAAGAAAAALFFIFKRRGYASDPSEWQLPSFNTTQQFLSQQQAPCKWGSGFTPFRRADGTCVCEPVKIEILAYGSKCTTDAGCAAGICIDGTCQPESAWES